MIATQRAACELMLSVARVYTAPTQLGAIIADRDVDEVQSSAGAEEAGPSSVVGTCTIRLATAEHAPVQDCGTSRPTSGYDMVAVFGPCRFIEQVLG